MDDVHRNDAPVWRVHVVVYAVGRNRMIDIEYLEQKKSEIVAEHIRLYGLTELTQTEKDVIEDLNMVIKCLKEETKSKPNGQM